MSTLLDTPTSGFLLAKFRFNAGLSKKALARRIGVNPRTVTNWESGETPSPEHAKAVADVFGVKATDILETPWGGE